MMSIWTYGDPWIAVTPTRACSRLQGYMHRFIQTFRSHAALIRGTNGIKDGGRWSCHRPASGTTQADGNLASHACSAKVIW